MNFSYLKQMQHSTELHNSLRFATHPEQLGVMPFSDILRQLETGMFLQKEQRKYCKMRVKCGSAQHEILIQEFMNM